MYHGDMNERQRLELHIVRKEGAGEGKMAVNWTSTSNLRIFSRPFSSRVTGHLQQPLIRPLLILYSVYKEGPPYILGTHDSSTPLSHLAIIYGTVESRRDVYAVVYHTTDSRHTHAHKYTNLHTHTPLGTEILPKIIEYALPYAKSQSNFLPVSHLDVR